MSEPLKLLNEDYIAEQKTIEEAVNGEHFMYITGPFLGAEKRNRNGRIYKRSLIEREVNKFQTMIKNCEAVGELSHPDSGEINPDRAAILITELKMDGDLAIGKARILPTQCGETLKGLIRGGVHMGVSSRGTGSLGADNVVCEDYNLITIDAVYMPSCQDAYVNAVNESTQWVLDESTNLYIEKRVKVYNARQDFNAAIDKGGSKAIAGAFKQYMNAIKGVDLKGVKF